MRHTSVAYHYIAAVPRGERAKRIARRLIVAASICHALGACSLTMPIGAMGSDDDVTGSIGKPAPVLSPKLNGEDWRRAQSALGLAVDPQGNGAPVSWDNPESGMKGNFVAAGPLYLLENRVCRSFVATLNTATPNVQLQGSSCRLGPNEWMINEIKPWSAPH